MIWLFISCIRDDKFLPFQSFFEHYQPFIYFYSVSFSTVSDWKQVHPSTLIHAYEITHAYTISHTDTLAPHRFTHTHAGDHIFIQSISSPPIHLFISLLVHLYSFIMLLQCRILVTFHLQSQIVHTQSLYRRQGCLVYIWSMIRWVGLYISNNLRKQTKIKPK